MILSIYPNLGQGGWIITTKSKSHLVFYCHHLRLEEDGVYGQMYNQPIIKDDYPDCPIINIE